MGYDLFWTHKFYDIYSKTFLQIVHLTIWKSVVLQQDIFIGHYGPRKSYLRGVGGAFYGEQVFPDSMVLGELGPGQLGPGLLGPGQLGHVAMYKINWHLFPKCWQHISNTNIYITKCTFPYPAPQRAHRKPPTDIYPPNVGRIYPIQIYILQHVHSLTLGPKGRTENLQLTYFPQMLAANIQ